MKRRRLLPWVAVGLTAIAFGLRLHWLGTWELSFDEVASFSIARRPPMAMLTYLQGAIREHPPLYYLVLSAWMNLGDGSEFALRFPSVLLGTVTVALFYRCVAEWTGHRVGWVAAFLLTLSPGHIWASQTARMYAQVVLFSLLSIHFFWLLLRDGGRWAWVGFALTAIGGLSTHYYFAFLILVENVLLVLGGRRYRHLWSRWIGFHGAALALLALWLTGTGPRSTLISILQRGLVGSARWEGLVKVLNETAFGPYRHVDPIGLSVIGGLAVAGLLWTGRRRLWRGLGWQGALLAALWLLIPPVGLLALPILLEGRYVIGLVLPIYLLVAVTVVQLRSRWWPAALLALLAVALPTAGALPELYHDRFGTYRARVEEIRDQSWANEPLILNGPWQGLLLTYYDPGAVRPVPVPRAAPPGIVPEQDAQVVEGALAEAPRVWVSYDSLGATDPGRFVARWLYGHAHEVYSHRGLVLYYRSPEVYETFEEAQALFGGRLLLRCVGLGAGRVSSGDAVLLTLEWEAQQDVDQDLRMVLELAGEDGWVWASYTFQPAPYSLPATPWPAGEVRLERRGVLVPVGTPPGRYTVRLRVLGADGTPLLREDGSADLSLTTIEVNTSLETQAVGWVRSAQPMAVFDQSLELLRCQPWGDRFYLGHPLPFTCYWRARRPLEGAYSVRIRFVGSDGEVVREVESALSSIYPPSAWLPGGVIATHYGPLVTGDVPAGRYRLRLGVLDGEGNPLREDVDLFGFTVEWPPFSRWVPLSAHRLEATFGETIHLRGYNLTRTGGELRLALYWQADAQPTMDCFVFVHVGLADAPPEAQADGVPAGWLRPTTTWRPGEVITDEHVISLADVPPGQYGLYVGLYDPHTGMRLPAFEHGRPTPDGRVLLEMVEVRR